MNQPARSILSDLFLAKPPLELVTVAGRGLPNEERIYLKANQKVRLNPYIIIAGAYLQPNDAIPLQDHIFWLGNRMVEAGTWILVYTGPGVELVTHMRETKEPALVLHWGRQHTIFQTPHIVPCLIKIDPAAGSVQLGLT